MLKVGGENVAASEIEQVVAWCPGCARPVVAKKHPMLDEVRWCSSFRRRRRARAEGPARHLMAACRNALATSRCPRNPLRRRDARSTLEKVAKAELRKMLGRGQAAVFSVIASDSEAIHGASRQAWIASSLTLLAMTA